MISFEFKKSLGQQFDKLVLYTFNRRMPGVFDDSYIATAALEEVLDNTQVNRQKTTLYNLVAPGEHRVWLNTSFGEICCHARVRPAVRRTCKHSA